MVYFCYVDLLLYLQTVQILMKFPGGGGALIFSFIPRLGSCFGFQIFNFNIFGVFRKMNIFGGLVILWIYFRGHKSRTIFKGYYYAF